MSLNPRPRYRIEIEMDTNSADRFTSTDDCVFIRMRLDRRVLNSQIGHCTSGRIGWDVHTITLSPDEVSLVCLILIMQLSLLVL